MRRSCLFLRRRRSVGALAALTGAAVLATAAPPAHAVGETLQVWRTPSSGPGLISQPSVTLGALSRGSINVEVDDSRVLQTNTAGFGASFTDSSAYVLSQLKATNPTAYSSLMNKVFATSQSDGAGFTFWRVPMTSSDFTAAPAHWTSQDSPSQPFALTSYDTGRIIPVIKDALAINPNLRIVASPWSAPGWMKDNGSIICHTNGRDSSLLPQYQQVWADYFVKWINAYEANGVPIWGVTPQNEPLYCPSDYPGMTWTAANEASWVHSYLKPTLDGAGLGAKVILGFDHNWEFSSFPESLLNSTAAPDLGGIAWHCYDSASDPTVMTKLHNAFPAKSAFETECSSDTSPVPIINYGTAEMALLSAQNWAEGAITWNLALDPANGPALGGCGSSCVPLVTVDAAAGTYTLRNNYYQLAQVSRFVNVGARHIGSTVDAHGIVTGAFRNPDGQEVLVATNKTAGTVTFTVSWNGVGSFTYSLPSRATATFRGSVPAATVLPAVPAAGRTFKFLSRTSGKPFGVAGRTDSGAPAVQGTDNGDLDQQWTLRDAGGGWFNLINRGSGLGLDDPRGSTRNGTGMQQSVVVGTGSTSQQWQVTAARPGYYTVRNRASGLVLDLRDGGLSDGTAIQQWAFATNNSNQEWQLLPTA